MSYMDYSEHANVLIDKFGPIIANAFTQTAQDMDGMIRPNSILGRLRAWGNVMVGTDSRSQEKAFAWTVDPAAETAASYGAGDTYTADTTPSFGQATLDWKRIGVSMEWDDLVSLTSAPLKDGSSVLGRRMLKKMRAIVSAIETQLATDGTGNSSKDVTGFKAFLSDSNTYAGIAQTGNTYWQAVEVTASAALAKAHLRSAVGGLWDREVLGDDTHEMWMPRAIWEDYVDLYSNKIRTTHEDPGGDKVAAYYEDGQVSIPIFVLPSMPSTEIWVVEKTTELRLTDQAPSNETGVTHGEQTIMQEGIPIGIKPIFNNSDISGVWIRAFPQLGNMNPRNNACIISLS